MYPPIDVAIVARIQRDRQREAAQRRLVNAIARSPRAGPATGAGRTKPRFGRLPRPALASYGQLPSE